MSQSSFTLRPRTEADRSDVRAICSRALAPQDGSDPDGLDRVLWSEGIISIVAEVDGVTVGVIAGSTFAEDGSTSAAVTVIAVDEPYRHRGIGRALLAALEAAAREAGATAMWSGGGQPRFWWPGIDDSDQTLVSIFTRSGYEFDDFAPNMNVDLTSADLASRPVSNITIHRLEPDEFDAFFSWMDHEWDDPWGAESRGAIVRTPIACHVALLDGEFIGFAAYDTNRRGWFGPMGTSPRSRGTGVGAELLRRCLRDYVDQGLTSCEIGWIGPAAFYEKTVGAVPGRRFVRLRKSLR